MSSPLRRFGTVAVLAATLLCTLAPAAGANPHRIQFARIQYDTPGADTPITNARLNGEYFVVKNLGTTTVNINGFTVSDAQSHVYTFPSTGLAAGTGIRVHTGRGTNTRTDRYWNRSTYVWNNPGDTATLRNAAGTELDVCGWTSTGPGYKICPT
jgi:hypothetical protein